MTEAADKQIAEFVEVESGMRSDRPQLAAAMALAKTRKATLLKARSLEPLRRLHRHAAASISPFPTCRVRTG